MLLPLTGKIRRSLISKVAASLAMALMFGLVLARLLQDMTAGRSAEGSLLLVLLSVVLCGIYLGLRWEARSREGILLGLEKLAAGEADLQVHQPAKGGELGRLYRILVAMAENFRHKQASEAKAIALAHRIGSRLEEFPLGILCERQGTIIECNETLARLFGYRPDELTGQPCSILLDGDLIAPPSRFIMASGSGSLRPAIPTRYRRKDGHVFPGLLAIGPDPGGEAGLQLWVCGEIEPEYVAEVAKEAAWKPGIQAEARAGAEPGTATMQGLPRTPAPNPPEKEEGQGDLETMPYDLPSLLGGMAILLSAKAEARGLELIFDMDGDSLPMLVGDPLYLSQILTLLISRTIRHSHRGEILVTVQESSRNAGYSKFQFGIHGQSIGLRSGPGEWSTPEAPSGSDTLRPLSLSGGDSLELAMCRQLVESLGGKLWMESQPGQEESFHFTARFPCREAVSLPAGREGRARPFQVFAGRRVMVIDDSESNRRVAGKWLAHLGFQPDLFASGQEALAHLAKPAIPGYLFCCLDSTISDGTAPEIAKRLRIHYGGSCPPLILMSALYDSPRPVDYRGEFSAVFRKPLVLEQMAFQLERVFRLPGDAGQPKMRTGGWPPPGYLKERLVLLVGGSEQSREILADFLDAADLRVRIAADGMAALQSLREERPDCIIVECRQPEGCLTAARLRELGFPRLPMIGIVDGCGEPVDQEACRSAGMNEILERPVDLSNLLTILARWLCPPNSRPGADGNGPLASSSPGTGSGAQEDLPPLPPGLDVESGLKRLRGQKALFLKALRIFRDSRGQQFQSELRAAVATEDWQTSGRLARSLMKTASHIGANDLSHTAARLEIAIRTGNHGVVTALLAEVNEKLRIIVEGLSRIG